MLRRMWKPADALSLSPSQRADLEALVRSGKTPQRVAARAAIVLAAADGTADQRDRAGVRRQSADGLSVAAIGLKRPGVRRAC